MTAKILNIAVINSIHIVAKYRFNLRENFTLTEAVLYKI